LHVYGWLLLHDTRAQDAIVFVVVANPKPLDTITFGQTEGTIMQTYAD